MRFPTFLLALLLTGCAGKPANPAALIPVAAPRMEGGSSAAIDNKTLGLKVIRSARQSIRMAACSFASFAIVRALIDAKRRGVDVQLLVEERENHGKTSTMLKLVASAGIAVRTISADSTQHDNYIVADEKHVQTGALDSTFAASEVEGENAVVVWNSPELAEKFSRYWDTQFSMGAEYSPSF